jgi:hypothetical protein
MKVEAQVADTNITPSIFVSRCALALNDYSIIQYICSDYNDIRSTITSRKKKTSYFLISEFQWHKIYILSHNA